MDNFWNQIRTITEQLNDDDYTAEWKERLLNNHKPSYIKDFPDNLNLEVA